MRRQPKKEGFGLWGPFPSYSRRTRGGGQVRVAGCCLPLTLGLGVATALPPALLWRRARRR